MYISYSRASCYLSCPYSHWLRYVRRLERKRPEKPLYFGTDFHKLLELRNNKAALKAAKEDIKDTYYSIPASWQADLGESYLDDLFTIFKDYQKLYKDTRQPQVTEQDFKLDVGTYRGEEIVFVGKIDELYLLKYRGEKYITVGEHKTFSQKPNAGFLVMNPQKCLYAKAVQYLRGILPQKVKWDYIRSVPAASPIWLEKSGRFSTASTTKVTPMSWMRACKEKGITDRETLNLAERYRCNIPEFFFQVELDIDPEMVESVWDSFVYTAKQIIRFGEKNKTKNITKSCQWCSYYDICYAEMTGGDVEYTIAKDYKEKGV